MRPPVHRMVGLPKSWKINISQVTLHIFAFKIPSVFEAQFILTLMLVIYFRIEKLGLRTIGGRVKVVGTILCVAGAIVITLYRGKPLHMQHSHAHNDHSSTKKITKEDMVHGSLLLVGSCLGSAAWFISQVWLHLKSTICIVVLYSSLLWWCEKCLILGRILSFYF